MHGYSSIQRLLTFLDYGHTPPVSKAENPSNHSVAMPLCVVFFQTHTLDANLTKGSFTLSQSFMQVHLPYFFYCVIYKEANIQRDDEWGGT